MSLRWSNAKEGPNFLLEMLPSNLGKSMFVLLIVTLHKREHQVEWGAWPCAHDFEWENLST